MKKLLILLLALALALFCLAACGLSDDADKGKGGGTPPEGGQTPEDGETPEENASTGLAYELSDDGTYYTVTGIGKCTDTDVVIPSEYRGIPVTSIGMSAFEDCKSLTSITIPDSVTSIGHSAFSGCTSLEFNEYENAYYLGNEANPYVGLVNAKDTSITSVAIHENTRFIYSDAFSGCTSLASVTIPDSVTSIDYYAFSGCTSLTSITIGNGVTSIGAFAFMGCTNLTSVVIPDSVTSIGPSAFLSCGSLRSVTIPDSVTAIGDMAFHISEIYGCIRLNLNEYKNAYYLGNEANPYMVLATVKDQSITSVTIHENTKFIYTSAFSYCTSLTSVVIPDGVTSIGRDAFYNCESLESVTIPDSVTFIGKSAFAGCSSLSDVYINDIAAWCNINFELSSANPLSNYGTYLYINGELVTELIIPDSVTSIGSYAFVAGLGFLDSTSFTSVTIPDSVTFIGLGAFEGCTSLTIYCEAESEPDGWDPYWNYSECPVVWGYKTEG